ncbi:Probable Co/Zn/Cd efflux system membrane fusion protein [hydrothermal vent metagenome]|uniref:Probable Co/Zn/Cd efflux system membrane fusion protein n=1 Tax=hydrothermal vent metagenome TaxID=652676 RepID=A0A3B0TQJ9_9ZZZZ
MKKTILTTIVLILTVTVNFAQSKSVETEATFGVRGNCGMCKSTIEKAANSIDGVSSATWDKENKKIDVSFDATKTSLDKIHNAIAASGYDTDKVKADGKAYNNLAGCCQYDKEMKMNISTKKKDDHSGHKH